MKGLFFLTMLATASIFGVASGDEIDLLLSRLGTSDPVAYAGALDALKSRGQEAALRALADFDAVGFRERRARSRVVVDTVTPACIHPILAHLEDEDPLVRRLFCRALGALNLGPARVEERVTALARRAGEDPSIDVRREAVTALSNTGSLTAVPVLDRLLDELPPGERVHCARAMVELPAARSRLCARVVAAFQNPLSAPSAPVLSILLGEYGKALADLPGGGALVRERVPFIAGRHHPSPEVSAAAARSLDRAMARMVEFSELDRADELLATLGYEGLDTRELFYRRANLALTELGDPERTRSLARSLQRAARGARSEERGRWLFFGKLYEAVARFAAGELEAAREGFEASAELCRALFAERPDLQPDPWAEDASRYGGSLGADRLQLAGVVEIWSALTYLDRGDPETWRIRPPDARAFRHLRQAQIYLLRARVVGERAEALLDSSSLDSLIDRNMSPFRLVLTRAKIERFRQGRGLLLAHRLGRSLASIAPFEVPGFEPYPGIARELSDPLFDNERRDLLAELRAEERRVLERRWDDLRRREVRDRNAETRVIFRLRESRRAEEEERMEAAQAFAGGAPSPERLLEIYDGLASYLHPSRYALNLADFMRVEGLAAEARALAERALEDHAAVLPGSNSAWSELMSAQLELSIGSTLMDEDRPQEAEKACLAAAERLEAFENTLEEFRGSTRPGSLQAASVAAQLRQTKNLRAQVFLSLAVNANVRLKDTDRALEYFEEAYELDQREFMRVLLACYRARSGKQDEARGVLVGIDPRPALYYNLACTYALLGEAEPALDYLARDLEENHRTRGSRLRQVEWARGDPDLASLRNDPRFERLLQAAESK